VCKNLHVVKMPKRMREGTGASKASKAKKRAIARYGASAVQKYYSPQRKLIGQRESGYVDLASSSYACDTTGTITLIATIAQGTSVQQRVGKKVMLKSMQMRGLASAGTAATINDIAYLIVYDRRPTGSLPAITDILSSASSRAQNNDDNTGRFRILKRKDIVLVGNSTTPTTGRESINQDWFLKLNKPEVFKAAGTGAIGDIEEGAMYLVTVGSVAAGTGAATLTCTIRTRFVDV